MEKHSNIDGRLGEIRTAASKRYGAGAEFAYPTGDGKFAMLTLDDAIAVCGQHIASADAETVQAMLDKFHKTAELIKSKSEKLAQTARAIGRASLERFQ